jgi:hypothetical protein
MSNMTSQDMTIFFLLMSIEVLAMLADFATR